MFIDEAEIVVRSGTGGNGMVHFHREKFVPRGGPDGGDGGHGGSIVFAVQPALNTLQAFRRAARYVAANGQNGGPNNRTGKAAKDTVIAVPPGTVVYDSATGEPLCDLVGPADRFEACKGGRGGRGNQHFATARNQTPRTAEKGEPGEEKLLRLELRLIADVGIIGMPNAGKSTLLAALTNAHPKIAPYPFTTLEPNLGVARLDNETAIVLADIPGLIKGASDGAGLGHDFLRHVRRTRALIHLLDGGSSDPIGDYRQINSELALYDQSLAHIPQVVALNKIDEVDVQQRASQIRQAFKPLKVDLLMVSALGRTNLNELLRRAARAVSQSPPRQEAPTELPVYRSKDNSRDFRVERLAEHNWRVSGSAIERAAAMTYWEHEGSVRRFQRLMQSLGVDDALRKAGVAEGDTVKIGEFELDWQD